MFCCPLKGGSAILLIAVFVLTEVGRTQAQVSAEWKQYGNLEFMMSPWSYLPPPHVGEVFTFAAARSQCQAMGGDLASIANEATRTWLLANLVPPYDGSCAKYQRYVFWIGLLKPSGDACVGCTDNWIWADGSSYDTWAENMWSAMSQTAPGEGERHAVIHGCQEYKWRGALETAKLRFICQRIDVTVQPLIENVPDSALTASSSHPSCPTTHSRPFDDCMGRGCCAWHPASGGAANCWIQVDLGQVYRIRKVATQGRGGANQHVTKYIIGLSLDGQYYIFTEEMTGNNDQTTIVENEIPGDHKARYVKLMPKGYNNYPALRWEVYGSPLSVEPLIENVPDSALTASSSHPSCPTTHSRPFDDCMGRGCCAWHPASGGAPNCWIQVDLGQVYLVRKVATQGRGGANQHVSKYKIGWSRDGQIFTFTQEMTGNNDQTTIVENEIPGDPAARYVRLMPTTYSNYPALRWDVYGFVLPTCSATHALIERRPDSALTASSYHASCPPTHSTPFDDCLRRVCCAWHPYPDPSNSWIQVDLGQVHLIRKVATQGRGGGTQYITGYKLGFSLNNVDFMYTEELPGNSDTTTIVENEILGPWYHKARYVRLVPSAYVIFPGVRWELYGCLA